MPRPVADGSRGLDTALSSAAAGAGTTAASAAAAGGATAAPLNLNELFAAWMQEWADEAALRHSKVQYTLKKVRWCGVG